MEELMLHIQKYVIELRLSPVSKEICKKLHLAIDKIDETRYDVEAKVQKADKEVRKPTHG